METKPPPHSLSAETAVIGAALLNNEVLTHITLAPEDFYRGGHQVLFRAMVDLEASGKPIDLVTLAEKVKGEGNLEKVGGMAYISSLTNAVPSIANAEHHAAIVRKMAQQRRIINSCYEIAQEAYESDDLEEINNRLLDVVERDDGIKESYTSMEAARQWSEEYEMASKGEGPQSLKTGLCNLDNLVDIGNSDLVIIAGRPGMGKTSFVCTIARNVAHDIPTAFFSMEMKVSQIMQVFVAQETNMSRPDQKRGKKLDEAGYKRLGDVLGKHSQMPYEIFPKARVTPAYIRKQAKIMKKRKGLGLIIVDYLQIMRGGIKADSKTVEYEHCLAELKSIAKEIDVPVLLLAQLNRNCEDRPDKRPEAHDVKWCGAAEQDADTMLMLFRPEQYWPHDDKELIEAAKRDDKAKKELEKRYKRRNELQVICTKQRSGPTGVADLLWNPESVNVTSAAHEGYY